MLNLETITKTYRAADIETAALNGININIEAGEFVAIMGPSGCGKSTLLNLIGMLDTPSAGRYVFDGQVVSGLKESELADVRKRNIGFIFQSFNLIDELTVRENIELALLYHQGISPKERRQRANEALDRMGIAHRANHMPAQLSGGQQQRVAVARAIVAQPKLILADEPTGNLDSRHGQEVMDLLKELNQSGATIVMVTHSKTHAEQAKRVITLLDGQVINNIAMAA